MASPKPATFDTLAAIQERWYEALGVEETTRRERDREIARLVEQGESRRVVALRSGMSESNVRWIVNRYATRRH